MITGSTLTLDCPDCGTVGSYTFDLEAGHEAGSERPCLVVSGPYVLPGPLCSCGPMNVHRINRLQDLAGTAAREYQEDRRYEARERPRDY